MITAKEARWVAESNLFDNTVDDELRIIDKEIRKYALRGRFSYFYKRTNIAPGMDKKRFDDICHRLIDILYDYGFWSSVTVDKDDYIEELEISWNKRF